MEARIEGKEVLLSMKMDIKMESKMQLRLQIWNTLGTRVSLLSSNLSPKLGLCLVWELNEPTHKVVQLLHRF